MPHYHRSWAPSFLFYSFTTFVRKRNTIPSYETGLETELRVCHWSHGKLMTDQDKQLEERQEVCKESLLPHQPWHHYGHWTAGQYTRLAAARASEQITPSAPAVHFQALLLYKNGALDYFTNRAQTVWNNCFGKDCVNQVPRALLKMLTEHHFTPLYSVRLQNRAWLCGCNAASKWGALLCSLFREE